MRRRYIFNSAGVKAQCRLAEFVQIKKPEYR